jgi:hypothetical protein
MLSPGNITIQDVFDCRSVLCMIEFILQRHVLEACVACVHTELKLCEFMLLLMNLSDVSVLNKRTRAGF